MGSALCSGSHYGIARGTVTNTTFKHYGNPVTSRPLTRTPGRRAAGGWSLRNGLRNKISGRRWLRLGGASGLLVVLSPRVALPPWQQDGNPNPPSQAQINAAENHVRQQQAALGAQQGRVSAAATQLAGLQVQAEVLTQRYDQTLVDEQRAAAAYRVTEARLGYAQQAQEASQRQLAGLAEQEFESGGGFGPMTSMIGNASGPQGYLTEVGLGQVLAQNGTDTVAEAQANDVVAAAFRKQAHDLLVVQQADLRAASDLKVAVQAAVARQQAFVSASRAKRNTLAQQLANAQAHAAALKSARQAAPGAAAPPPAAPGGGGAGPDSYDCSGMSMMAWAHAGVQLLHYTGYQWEEGPHVPLTELQRGDLLFYATNTPDPSTIHPVAIYIGRGMMVNAPFTGAFVRIDSIYAPGGLIGAV